MNTEERAALRKAKPGVWVPVQAGDRITGHVVDIQAAWSDTQYDGKDADSGFYPLLRIDTDGEVPVGYEQAGIYAVHCFARVLQARVIDHEPTIGELVTITYEGTGEKKQRGRSAPELFRLELPERDPAAVARQVYGKLRGKVRGAGAQPVEESDLGEAEVETT